MRCVEEYASAQKVVREISKSGDEIQGFKVKKVKLSNEVNDFILKDYTIITRSKLVYQKVQHDLNYLIVNFSFSLALDNVSFRYVDFHLGIVTKSHFKYQTNLSELFNLYCFLMISGGLKSPNFA